MHPIDPTLPMIPHTTSIIGLSGKARHGKDSFGSMLRSAFYTARTTSLTYAFAGALYDLCRREYGMTDKDAPLLQRVGLEERAKDDLVWVRKVFDLIVAEQQQVAIITDVRFKNEAKAIRDAGGVLIRLTRWTSEGVPFVDPSRPADHVSETDLDDYSFDEWVENTGSPDDLWPDVFEIAAGVLAGRREIVVE